MAQQHHPQHQLDTDEFIRFFIQASSSSSINSIEDVQQQPPLNYSTPSAASSSDSHQQEIASFSLPKRDTASAVPKDSKKAIIARENRKKKKEYVKELEDKVKSLENRLVELKSRKRTIQQFSIGESGEEQKRTYQKQLVDGMAQMIKMEDCENREGLEEIVKLFVQTHRSNVISKLDEQLDRIQSDVQPPIEIKFSIWGLDQNDEFYENPMGLWSSLLVKEMELSEEQLDTLKRFRGIMRKHRDELTGLDAQISNLREMSHSYIEQINQGMNEFYSILKPIQLAKFFCWIEKNQWCMQMLNNFWNTANETEKKS